MHPSSPHSPSRRRAAAEAQRPAAHDPLDALEQEINGKVVPGSPACAAHPAAAALTLARPRRATRRDAGLARR